ncbi:MAG: hypothetical protein U0694_28970, partial [Anaerolineae bacterium]
MNETPLSQELDTIVEDCLDAIQRGDATLEDCLRRYPAAAAELKPLLQIALLTSRLKAPQMSAERVQALDKQLRTSMPPQTASRPQSSIRLWQPFVRLAAALLVIAVLALGSGAGLVSASENTLPGDTLYPVKRVWESARVTFALVGQQDDVLLDIARHRLDEVIRLDQQQRLDQKAMVDL